MSILGRDAVEPFQASAAVGEKDAQAKVMTSSAVQDSQRTEPGVCSEKLICISDILLDSDATSTHILVFNGLPQRHARAACAGSCDMNVGRIRTVTIQLERTTIGCMGMLQERLGKARFLVDDGVVACPSLRVADMGYDTLWEHDKIVPKIV